MLLPRLLSALIAIPLLLTACFQLSLAGFVAMALGICLLAAWEWGPLAGFSCYQQRVPVVLLVAGILIAMLCCVPLTAELNKQLLVQLILGVGVIWWLVALCLVWCYPSASGIWSKSCCWRLLFCLGTIVPFFWGVLVLRVQSTQQTGLQNGHEGIWWLLYVLILIWSADSAAYIIGKYFGKHALLPRVSPGKTWEGFVGGVLVALIVGYLLMHYGPLTIPCRYKWMIITTLTVMSSVLGDLSESMFKRAVGLKQSGHWIPGHGGILDRIDSLTAAIPIFTCSLLLVL